MRSYIKTALLGSVALCFLLGVLLFLNRASIEATLKERLIFEIQAHKIRASIENLSLRPWGVTLSKVELFFPKLFLNITLDEVTLVPRPGELFSGRSAAAISARAYGGTLSGVVESSFTGKDLYFSGRIVDLVLGTIPFLQGLGVGGGTSQIDLTMCHLTQQVLSRCDGALKITGLQKPRTTILSGRLTRLPMDLTLPGFQDGSVTGKFALRTSEPSHITEAAFISTLGSVSADLTVAALQPHAPISSGLLRVDLSDTGVPFLGPLFSFIVAGNQPDARTWQATVSGTTSRPLFKLVRHKVFSPPSEVSSAVREGQ